MTVLFAIQEDNAGMWRICRGQACLVNRLTLARAITEARRLARDHHAQTGLTASVDLVSPEGTTRLAHHAHPGAEVGDVAAA